MSRDDHVLLRARHRVAQAEEARRVAYDALRHAFPVGCEVIYRWGEHRFRGVVMDHGGVSDLMLRVQRIETGKGRWIRAAGLIVEDQRDVR